MDSIRNSKHKARNSIIYPVVLAVPNNDERLTGREQVAKLSNYARRALEISAQKNCIVLSTLSKDENGVPLPMDGYYWSLTHKPIYVGGVIASNKIGIDIELIRPCSKALFKKTALDSEWTLSSMDSLELFFRYWTSKESVLKASGIGIRDLSKCRIVKIVDDNNLIIHYKKQNWFIEHFSFDGHIASVVKNDSQVQWTLLNPFVS